MTNNEIIKFLQSKQIPQCGDKVYTADEEYEAYQRAIDALEQQLCDDAISREAAIKVTCNDCKYDCRYRESKEYCDCCGYIDRLRTLPSVTSKPIECDDAISRDAAINIASLHCLTIDETVKAIKNLPSVTQKSAKDYLDMADRKAKKIKDALTDNSQKYGKWIVHPEIETSTPEYLMFYECSECGNKQCFCKSDIHKKRFCSNCGAKMQESEKV